MDSGATFTGDNLPREGDEVEVVRSDGERTRALVRLVGADEDPPITAVLIE